MHKNKVDIRGAVSWNPPPYFDLVSPRDKTKSQVAFLRFNVLVKRDKTQDDAFPYDSIRVVSYGSLAERTYAILEQDAEIEVSGWLQSRKTRQGTILEVVALDISTTGQILTGRIMKRLRAIATQQGVEVNELTRLLLEPQLVALESSLGQNGNAEGNDGD